MSPTLKTLVRMLSRHRGVLIAALVLSLIGSALSLVQPLIVNDMLNQFGQQPVGPQILLLVLLLVVGSAAGGLQIYLLTRTAEKAVSLTRAEMVTRILRLPIPVLDKQRTGDLVTRLGSDTTLIRSAFTGGLVDAVASLFTMAGAVVLMAMLDPLLLVIVLVVLSITVAVVAAASGKIQQYTVRLQEAVGELGADAQRALVAVRTIRAANAQSLVEEELGAKVQDAYRQGQKIARFEGLLYPATGLAVQACFLIVLGVGGARVAAGHMALGELVAFVMYLFTLAMPIGMLFEAITTIRSAMGAVERIGEIMVLPEENDQGPDIPAAGSLRFEEVSFAYEEGGKEMTLDRVSFSIPEGSTTAFVGPSGSGKSTILALMQRFYDPQSGAIYLGDNPVAEFNRRSLRRVIGFVEQEAAVLSGTVRENLLLGNTAASDERCLDVLAQVGLAEKFAEGGLDTVLGERGLTLSGGQRQRLALARMLLLDTPILILDEPTSAVDSRNEQAILAAISESALGRTVVMVAHRLSTVMDADHILVIDAGRVVGEGTHQELIESNPLYRDLAQRQDLLR